MMTTCTSRSINAIFFQLLAGVLICACVAIAADRDLYVSSLVLYARLSEQSVEAKEHGKYPQLKSYNLHSGLAPDNIDVIAVVNGNAPEGATVVLEVIPVVGLTNWQATEGITETQMLDNSKTAMPVFLRLEQKVRFDKRTDVKFANVSLRDVIRHYRERGFWPAEVLFRTTIEPVAGETSLANNVMQYRLSVSPPD
jgi:hypothetical protein